MPVFEPDISIWRERFVASLPVALRAVLEGSSRRELLKKSDTTLLVFNNRVIDLETGDSKEFPETGDKIDLQRLALASRSLLDQAQKAQKAQKESSIILLLPPAEFISTTLSMPGVSRDNLVSALKLQIDTLLPGYEEPLSLAINPSSVDQGDERVALWITDSKLASLFNAFEQQEIFLAAVMPRILGVSESEAGIQLLDDDDHTITLIRKQGGVLVSWHHVIKLDLEQEKFASQWEKVKNDMSSLETVELSSESDYLDLPNKNINQEYCFFPQGALNAKRKQEKGRKVVFALAASVVFIGLASIPFLMQTWEFRQRSQVLEINREASTSARQDQTAVINFENEWGPVNDFPQQRVREAMYTLQAILSPDMLTSMEVSEGLIKIQGTSTEPQAILQRLEQDPMFTEVVFSRATNNSRYYIDLRLSTVNFEAYMVRYFPDD